MTVLSSIESDLSSLQGILSTLETDLQSWEQQLSGSGSSSSSSGSDLETLFLEMLLAEMASSGSDSSSLFGSSSNQPVLTDASFNSGSTTSPSTSVQPVSNSGSVQTILQNTAAQFGWGSGSEWQSLSYVENREAGFNPTAINPTSGALGLAQALGHGNANTAGRYGNEYGGYGLTDAQARAANNGDPAAQALWMMNYIKDRYGTPEAAAAHEQTYGWY
jgi:hypothetical protein